MLRFGKRCKKCGHKFRSVSRMTKYCPSCKKLIDKKTKKKYNKWRL